MVGARVQGDRGQGTKGGSSHQGLGEDVIGPLPLRTTPTLLQGNVHLAFGKAVITRFLPDTATNTPAATGVLHQTFYLLYICKHTHVSSKIARRAMQGNSL